MYNSTDFSFPTTWKRTPVHRLINSGTSLHSFGCCFLWQLMKKGVGNNSGGYKFSIRSKLLIKHAPKSASSERAAVELSIRRETKQNQAAPTRELMCQRISCYWGITPQTNKFINLPMIKEKEIILLCHWLILGKYTTFTLV